MKVQSIRFTLLVSLLTACPHTAFGADDAAIAELSAMVCEFYGVEPVPEAAHRRMQTLIAEIADQGPAADVAIPHLVAAFHLIDDDLRSDAARAIGKVCANPEQAFPPLIVFGYGRQAYSRVRVNEHSLIEKAGGELSDQAILALSFHADWRVRCWAAHQLGERIEKREQSAYTSTLEQMQRKLDKIRDYRERNATLRKVLDDAMVKVAGHLTAVLTPMLNDPDPDVRAFALLNLSRSSMLGEPFYSSLPGRFKDEGILRYGREDASSGDGIGRVTVRRTAIAVAGQDKHAQARAILLAAAVNDDDAKVREGCLLALWNVRNNSRLQQVVEVALKDESDAVFDAAVRLSRGKTPSPAVISALTAALEQESRRQKAAEALAGFGSASAPAVPLLTQSLERGSCQQEVIRCLGRIGVAAEPALPAIRAQLNSVDPRLRILAARAVWNITQQPDDVMLVYMELLPDRANRAQVCEGLGEMKSAAAPAVGPLVELLSANGKDVRIMRTLGEIGPAAKAALPVLDSVAEHAQSPYSTRAKEAASRIRSEAAK